MELTLKELIRKTYESLRDLSLSKYYPFIENFNIFEEGSLHSLILTALTIIGFDLGFAAINEKNIYNKENAAICQRKGKPIRPDCIWMDNNTGTPYILFEFEQKDIITKIENLFIVEDDLASGNSRNQVIKLFVLIYTTKTNSKINYNKIFSMFRQEKIKIYVEKENRKKFIKYPNKNIPLLMLNLNYSKNSDSYLQRIIISYDTLFWNKKRYDYATFKKLLLT